jgi:nucleoside-diphosphate-sugar epimerase
MIGAGIGAVVGIGLNVALKTKAGMMIINRLRSGTNGSSQLTGLHPIEEVKQEETGFDNYGHLKHFNIDKSLHKNVLITGSNSYIGESFVNYCAQYYPNITITTLDVKDERWREHTFKTRDGKTYDSVFHVAGIAHADVGKVSVPEQEKYYAVNTDLAIECCEKARKSGVKQFIFISSMIIYGGAKRINEKTMPNPANFYGNSKWLADKGVRALAEEGYNVAVLRSPMVYGKGAKGNYQQLEKLAKIIPVFPDIRNKRSMIYIENLCEFIAKLTLSCEGGIFFPQNNEYSDTSQLVKCIAEVSGHKVYLMKCLIPFVKIAKHISGKTGEIVNKVFGSSYYDQNLSNYEGLFYCKYNLKESVYRIER